MKQICIQNFSLFLLFYGQYYIVESRGTGVHVCDCKRDRMLVPFQGTSVLTLGSPVSSAYPAKCGIQRESKKKSTISLKKHQYKCHPFLKINTYKTLLQVQVHPNKIDQVRQIARR